MATVFEFYVPKNFRRQVRDTSQLQPGMVIEFRSQARTSARARTWRLGRLVEATESDLVAVSE
jgi:hypothetical protein